MRVWNQYEGQELTSEKIVELLVHGGKVPVWIDLTVRKVTPEHTVLELYCCRRLRADDELMHKPIAPFSMKVARPPDYQKDVLFDVNWKMRVVNGK